MSSDNTYNGYKNYETCTVCLWLNNDQVSQQAWTEEARGVRAEAAECQQVKEGIWSAPQAERFLLADALKNDVEDRSPLKDPSLYADLLHAALSEVDWHEVADEFLDLLGPREDDAPVHRSPAASRAVDLTGKPKFPLGQVVATPGALAQLTREEIQTALNRHVHGDWGHCCDEDWQENDFSLNQRLRLFSVYHSQAGQKFWVITEADRSATTVLLPSGAP
jgi:hypothetical protein